MICTDRLNELGSAGVGSNADLANWQRRGIVPLGDRFAVPEADHPIVFERHPTRPIVVAIGVCRSLVQVPF